MTVSVKKNIPDSVKQRLLNKAREGGLDYVLLLRRYALERLLYRISVSSHRKAFILKGAMLLHIWRTRDIRPTKDLDLLGSGEPSQERLHGMFNDICKANVADDGLVFNTRLMKVEEIREGQAYEGLRVTLKAALGNTIIPIQVDIGFGDSVVPEPIEEQYPVILDYPAPIIRAYPRESVVAEKFEAMVKLGIINSRMKDFYDIWYLAENFEFDGQVLCKAIQATFERRQTPVPQDCPVALTKEFTEANDTRIKWGAFIRRLNTKGSELELSLVIGQIRNLLLPCLTAINEGLSFDKTWKPGSGWDSTVI